MAENESPSRDSGPTDRDQVRDSDPGYQPVAPAPIEPPAPAPKKEKAAPQQDAAPQQPKKDKDKKDKDDKEDPWLTLIKSSANFGPNLLAAFNKAKQMQGMSNSQPKQAAEQQNKEEPYVSTLPQAEPPDEDQDYGDWDTDDLEFPDDSDESAEERSNGTSDVRGDTPSDERSDEPIEDSRSEQEAENITEQSAEDRSTPRPEPQAETAVEDDWGNDENWNWEPAAEEATRPEVAMSAPADSARPTETSAMINESPPPAPAQTQNESKPQPDLAPEMDSSPSMSMGGGGGGGD